MPSLQAIFILLLSFRSKHDCKDHNLETGLRTTNAYHGKGNKFFPIYPIINNLLCSQRSLQEKVLHNETPEARNLFLNLTIRRAHIIEDSINEVRSEHIIIIDSYIFSLMNTIVIADAFVLNVACLETW